jgi:hypothetical protein
MPRLVEKPNPLSTKANPKSIMTDIRARPAPDPSYL